MTLLDLLLLLLIAGICGSIGQAIAGYSRGGCLVSIALGFIGALIGMWLARQLGWPELIPVVIGGVRFSSILPVIWADQFSDHLVDHWCDPVRGRDHTTNAQPCVRHESVQV